MSSFGRTRLFYITSASILLLMCLPRASELICSLLPPPLPPAEVKAYSISHLVSQRNICVWGASANLWWEVLLWARAVPWLQRPGCLSPWAPSQACCLSWALLLLEGLISCWLFLVIVSQLGPPSHLSLATLTVRDRCLPFLPYLLWRRRSRNLLFYMHQSNEKTAFGGAHGLSVPWHRCLIHVRS